MNKLPQSGMGIASLVIGLLNIVSNVMHDVLSMAIDASVKLPTRDAPTNYIFNGWLLANIVLNLVGIVFGIGGVVQKQRRHSVAIAGLVLNFVLPMLLLGAMVLSLREHEYARADSSKLQEVETRGDYPPSPPSATPLLIGAVPCSVLFVLWRRQRSKRLTQTAVRSSISGSSTACPRCFKPHLPDTHFCRRCGLAHASPAM